MDLYKEFIPKELSWLSFNARLLQEAEDTTVPIVSRLKFLGIFSSNQDEFFEIRVATLKRLCMLRKSARKKLAINPKKVLLEVQEVVLKQQEEFHRIYDGILADFAKRKVNFVDEHKLTEGQKTYLKTFFSEKVRPHIFPTMIYKKFRMPELKHRSVYLAVELVSNKKAAKSYSLIEIPTEVLNRFVQLPSSEGERTIILLDDVIRFGLNEIFSVFGYKTLTAYCIKLSRDAELDIDDDIYLSYISKIQSSLRKRKQGEPVRFVYDIDMPPQMLSFLLKKIKMEKDAPVIPGGRYHNFRDFRDFPDLFPDEHPEKRLPLENPSLKKGTPLLDVVLKQDVMLHFPYDSFSKIIDLMREAALDPDVEEMKITLYRVAKISGVINALITARKNRKDVTVLLELQARYDEKANITWANRLKDEGIKVIFGISGLKVHSKLCLISKRQGSSKIRDYAIIGTGNFNEDTAKVYTDHALLTSRRKITSEVRKIFDFFQNNYHIPKFEHLVVSPFSNRNKMMELIENETEASLKGKESYIDLKLNNLADHEIIRNLYKASQAGVKIRILVRGMCSLIPGIPGLSENIIARSIVDMYLEHSRVYFFGNSGEERCYISSADLLPRNLDSRVEVSCPILDPVLHLQLRDMFNICWSDNVKSRIWDVELRNEYSRSGDTPVRSQDAIYEYLAKARV